MARSLASFNADGGGICRDPLPAPWPGESPADWVDRALAEGPFRRFKHPGNLAYGWPLWGGVELAETHPYATSEDLTP